MLFRIAWPTGKTQWCACIVYLCPPDMLSTRALTVTLSVLAMTLTEVVDCIELHGVVLCSVSGDCTVSIRAWKFFLIEIQTALWIFNNDPRSCMGKLVLFARLKVCRRIVTRSDDRVVLVHEDTSSAQAKFSLIFTVFTDTFQVLRTAYNDSEWVEESLNIKRNSPSRKM